MPQPKAKDESAQEGIQQYIYESNEFVTDATQVEHVLPIEYTDDVSYREGTHTVLVHEGSQYIIPTDSHTIVLQDDVDFEHLVINEGDVVNDEREIYDDQNEETRYIECDSSQQMLYYSATGAHVHFLSDQQAENCKIDSLCESIAVPDEIQLNVLENEQLPGEVKTETSYQYAVLKDGKLHLQSSKIHEGQGDSVHPRLHEQLRAFQDSISLNQSDVIGFQKITTGQTVAFNNYTGNICGRSATPHVKTEPPGQEGVSVSKDESGCYSSSCRSSAERLLNKKFILGKTASGKTIIGKILRIQRNGQQDPDALSTFEEDHSLNDESKALIDSDIISSSAHAESIGGDEDTDAVLEKSVIGSDTQNRIQVEELIIDDKGNLIRVDKSDENSQPQILIKRQLVPRARFDHNISKTLAGLMDLESVQRRLQYKNLIVKLVEKIYQPHTDTYSKTVSYVYGHMVKQTPNMENSSLQQWTFALDGDGECSGDANLGEDCKSDACEDEAPGDGHSKIKFPETASITLVIAVDNYGKRTTRVNLGSCRETPLYRCEVCNREFRSPVYLRKHWNSAHLRKISGDRDHTAANRNRRIHVQDHRFKCTKCGKAFNTQGSLKRHLTVHDPSVRPVQCAVCLHRFADQSSFKKHQTIHSGVKAQRCSSCPKSFTNQGDLNFHRRSSHDPVKQFYCDVCGREFSRHSNLLRHLEIHKGASALYKCEMCGCSYNFVSSLTRHVVQNHIARTQS